MPKLEHVFVLAEALGDRPEYLIFGRRLEEITPEEDAFLEEVITILEEVMRETGVELPPDKFARLAANLTREARQGVDITRERVRNWLRVFV